MFTVVNFCVPLYVLPSKDTPRTLPASEASFINGKVSEAGRYKEAKSETLFDQAWTLKEA